ncbi:MAG: hypothetical protein A3E21_09480 [Sulfurimonas sp. RIFCSPHIGHO2_12_FULL_36_9]|uniref:hypothetical protein n=1 Tax=Sulfurimonas sp. RIFCSPLOWO2_12_36_12 TaxID=1802253 RepID=UPI0008D43297|nr:hypothetical protein [Sulfurimonas sp. RIFCSPLOWO2_12_36_12]OHD96731.1 MAG: hypothetical protein A3E21_09480 [Sulfurimonas sp. RIFCSPHIGHO2_12_FULL_36_9]OHE00289.1 MAG: hypothetical protein A3J26_06710 [Sulfurimonas sp. RIFCSPLOWO2_02_FULL_36_28]OHE02100.1 MAG: hypothetical protein A2W82_05295 [Sulfurimonas sp. RIFCSPLOWO2_12_36_12]
MNELEKTNNTITVQNKVKDLVEKFSEMQEELNLSMKNVDEMTKQEIETGFYKGLTGKTDADISEQVKKLGLNLLTTQKVVMFTMELSHAKNEVLRGFHNALVDKLIELDKYNENISDDINISKKNERKIVTQIKEQIENRLALEESIEKNKNLIGENKNQIRDNKQGLSNLTKELQQKSLLDDEQSNILKLHKKLIEELSSELNAFKDSVSNNYPSKLMINIYGIISVVALILSIISLVK